MFLFIFMHIKGGFQRLLKLVVSFLLGLNMFRWGLKRFCLLHSAALTVPHDTQIPFLFLFVCPLWLKSHANRKTINHCVLFKPNPLSAAGRPWPGVFWEMWSTSDKGYLITSQSWEEIVGGQKTWQIYITSLSFKNLGHCKHTSSKYNDKKASWVIGWVCCETWMS